MFGVFDRDGFHNYKSILYSTHVRFARVLWIRDCDKRQLLRNERVPYITWLFRAREREVVWRCAREIGSTRWFCMGHRAWERLSVLRQRAVRVRNCDEGLQALCSGHRLSIISSRLDGRLLVFHAQRAEVTVPRLKETARGRTTGYIL